MENKLFYFSLTRGLQGCYVAVLATDEGVVREYANNYFNGAWCSVYTSEELANLSKRYKTIIINEDFPVELNDCPTYD